ncbi:putative mediator of rna polymerase ii transcription [Monocercomonoides exilis]|uniref:putative mediator of rna polymerase ii transcription n=1 Tax=Monocercomonoides exilis TaxID=2049356 RepID=UPI00355A690A|nr:putative mediator of rna polymerase ii transcription [Monocercomonoides exilis]|eukprot:MONOS_13425.1-p1 / transcript=MONOS_13425.1 / gene=MONOS_13425 / organism=Monocercomonoides_exilis_PA203 / gene_product=putative mediator complex subunit 6 / transcript_product=putative mediator complex subunit 6 / location=Mono_scaffold00826:26090-26891(+) / protein_length=195 / sequence_SO=supercontig / SO=protein_coding / is_pseudo=false
MDVKSKDLHHTSWRDDAWLLHNPLNMETVMEYFSRSSFYDHECNNEVVKMQQLPAERLRTLRGVEFSIEDHDTDLFIIAKRFRETETKTRMLDLYYVLYGSIYQSTDLSEILESRINRSLFFYRKALEDFRFSSEFKLPGGRQWKEEDKTYRSIEPNLLDIPKRLSGEEVVPIIAHSSSIENAFKGAIESISGFK